MGAFRDMMREPQKVEATSVCRTCGKSIEKRGALWYAGKGAATDICVRDRSGEHRPVKGKTQLAPLGPPRSKVANVLVYTSPSGYWYAQARDATTGKQIVDASGYSREEALRELRGKF